MSVELLGGSAYLSLFPEGRFGGYVLLFIYLIAALAILTLTYRDWLRLNGRRWGLLVALLLLGSAFQFLLLRFPGEVLLSPPGVPKEPAAGRRYEAARPL